MTSQIVQQKMTKRTLPGILRSGREANPRLFYKNDILDHHFETLQSIFLLYIQVENNQSIIKLRY